MVSLRSLRELYLDEQDMSEGSLPPDSGSERSFKQQEQLPIRNKQTNQTKGLVVCLGIFKIPARQFLKRRLKSQNELYQGKIFEMGKPP